MVDYFTKVAEIRPIMNKVALTVAQVFYDAWICRYGAPARITSDNGTEFQSDFKHMVARLGIEHIFTSANHPSANGAVERVNQTIKRMLMTHFNEHPTNWTKTLPQMQFAYMRSPHDSLDFLCPFQMLMGFSPKLPLPVSEVIVGMVDAPAQYVLGLQDRLRCQQDQIKLVLDRKANRNILARLRGRKRHNKDLNVGDLVLEVAPGRGPLQTNTRGPFLIVGLDDGKTHATLSTGQTHFKEARLFKRHTSHLVLYKPKPLPAS
jgi:hypothetical protein